MLTGYQCETVAYLLPDGGEFLCRSCALEALPVDEDGEPSDDVAKADLRLENESNVRGVIRYEMDEYNGERAYEYVEYELGLTWEKDREAFDKALRDYPDECCGSCGTEL